MTKGETLYMDIYDNGFVSNEYKEKFKHLINNFYVGVEENAELKNEVLEVRQHLELTEREWGKDTTKLIHFKTQLTKAKDLIEDLYDRIPSSHSDYYKDVMERARQFITEIDKCQSQKQH